MDIRAVPGAGKVRVRSFVLLSESDGAFSLFVCYSKRHK